MEKLMALLKKLDTKPQWGSKELKVELTTAIQSAVSILNNEGKINVSSTGKMVSVDKIKKYDILYLSLVGSPHYILIHKVTEDQVFGVVLSSKDKAHSIHLIKQDRFFAGGYATHSYLSSDIASAKGAFVRVYENRQEADEIFRKVKQHYQNVFKFKK